MSYLLPPFQALIKARSGLHLEDPNSLEKLQTTLSMRIKHLGLSKAEDYLARLSLDSQEFQALINQLTINETYFFREPEQIDLLINQLVPRLLAQKMTSAPIRILSAGCSSGEEPYSLVMALTEKYGAQTSTLFQFIGGDIDSQVLAKARAGIYGDFSFRGVSAERRHQFFSRNQHHNILRDNIRQQVDFVELNLFAPKQTAELSDFDIIFFRNVSIYFDTPARKVIQQNLANMLRDNGILVIGTAETLANDLGVLPLVEEQGLFYFIKGNLPAGASHTLVTPTTPSKAALTSTITVQTHPTQPPSPLRPLPATVDKDKLLQLIRNKSYDTALPIAEVLLNQQANDNTALLCKAYILLNRKQWSGAEGLLKICLEQDHWSLDAMLLLGLAAKWQGQNPHAIDWFKKAVYAHSDSWLAHYHLSDSYRQCEPNLALRGYRTTLQLLTKDANNTGLKVLPIELPPTEVRFLCEHQINKLSAAATAKGST
jgi:chemotaxis protein methyltransferase CheR